jgi:2-keto-4-pentenoate hydratase/2-oxohepta-3-ene-1,7-dioic acid hydratase in catechol pathway
MYLIRYLKDGREHAGHLDGETIGSLTGDIYGTFVRGGPVAQLSDVILLPPCSPSKIITLSLNFVDQLRALQAVAPELPPLRFKAPSALVGAGQPIRLPPQARAVAPGAALGVVLGRRGRWIGPDEAASYILGYTCANDVQAADVAELDQGWVRANSFDSFLPLGPAIATHPDPTELVVSSSVNGVVRQMATTHDLLFTVPQVVAFVSAAMTLLPGDLILMGTPAGAGTLAPGDIVEINIEGVGTLRNPVVAEG